MGILFHLTEIIKTETGLAQHQAEDLAYYIADDVDALIKRKYDSLYETEDDNE